MQDKAYKYRIYPNEDQQIFINKNFGCCRFVYNHFLAKKIELYQSEKKSLSQFDCNKICNNELKKEKEWLKEIDSKSLEFEMEHLKLAYDNFFRRVRKGEKEVGFPKFKKKYDSNKSYTTRRDIHVDFENNKIKLPKLGWIDCVLHRKFEGEIKAVTIKKVPSGKYFVSVRVKTEIEELPKNDKAIGFDLGLKEFLIDSNGNHEANPKHLEKYEEKLAKLQRQLSKMVLHSNNYKKQKIKIAKLHEHIANSRKDFLNKLSCKIVREFGVIISEDLNIAEMIKNSLLSKSIADVSWAEFTRQLEYKAKWYGRIYHKIDRWYASSQTCNMCDFINKKVKLLSIREWQCEGCGAIHQRDENAAINILHKGLEELKILERYLHLFDKYNIKVA